MVRSARAAARHPRPLGAPGSGATSHVLVVITARPPGPTARASAAAGRRSRRGRARSLERTARLPAHDPVAAGAGAGARASTLRWWSAWNEPNAASFVNPQRLTCSPPRPSVGPVAVRAAGAHAEVRRSTPHPATSRSCWASCRARSRAASAHHARRRSSCAACPTTSSAPGRCGASTSTSVTPTTCPSCSGWSTSAPAPARRAASGSPRPASASPAPASGATVNPRVLKLGCQRQNGLLLRWHADPRTDVATPVHVPRGPRLHHRPGRARSLTPPVPRPTRCGAPGASARPATRRRRCRCRAGCAPPSRSRPRLVVQRAPQEAAGRRPVRAPGLRRSASISAATGSSASS